MHVLFSIALLAAGLILGLPRSVHAQVFATQFNQAVAAVHGTTGFDTFENEIGTLTDGASFILPSSFTLPSTFPVPTGVDTVIFSGGQFAVPSTYTITSATQSGNIITFVGVRSTASGSVPYSCSIDVASGAFSGDCEGFLGLGGPAATQQAIAATSQGILRDQARVTSNMIASQLRDIARDLARGKGTGTTTGRAAQSGLSAGAEAVRYAVWADASGSFIKNDAAGKAYQGSNTTALSGLDAVIGNSWVVGFVAGYSRADLEFRSLNGTRLSQGSVVGPYVSYVFNEHFTVDGNINYSRLSNDVTVGSLHSEFSSNRYAAAFNGNYFADVGPVSLTGFAGYTLAYEHAQHFTNPLGDPFPALSTRYDAVKLGGEISYPMGNAEPYLPLTYEYQISAPEDGTSRSSLLVGIGLRYRIDDALKAGIVVTDEEFRSHERNATIAANLRFTF
jgi:uncharacterized protein with beta-barrel porin domain